MHAQTSPATAATVRPPRQGATLLLAKAVTTALRPRCSNWPATAASVESAIHQGHLRRGGIPRAQQENPDGRDP